VSLPPKTPPKTRYRAQRAGLAYRWRNYRAAAMWTAHCQLRERRRRGETLPDVQRSKHWDPTGGINTVDALHNDSGVDESTMQIRIPIPRPAVIRGGRARMYASRRAADLLWNGVPIRFRFLQRRPGLPASWLGHSHRSPSSSRRRAISAPPALDYQRHLTYSHPGAPAGSASAV